MYKSQVYSGWHDRLDIDPIDPEESISLLYSKLDQLENGVNKRLELYRSLAYRASNLIKSSNMDEDKSTALQELVSGCAQHVQLILNEL